MFFKCLLFSLSVLATLGEYCGAGYECLDPDLSVCCMRKCCKNDENCEDGECKLRSVTAIIISAISSLVIIGLLVLSGYKCYMWNEKEKAEEEEEEKRKKAYEPAPTAQNQLPTMTQDGENNQLIMTSNNQIIVLSPDQLKQIQNQLSGVGQQAQAK